MNKKIKVNTLYILGSFPLWFSLTFHFTSLFQGSHLFLKGRSENRWKELFFTGWCRNRKSRQLYGLGRGLLLSVSSIYVNFLRQGVWPVKKEGVADIGKQAEVLSVQVSGDLIILLHGCHFSFFSGKWSAGARRAWALARRWSLMLPPSTPSSPGLLGSSLTNNIFHPQCCGTVRVGTLWSSRR